MTTAMDTALTLLLKAVTEAKATLIAERNKPENDLIRDRLIDSIFELDQLANDIILLDIAQHAATLQADADRLRELSKTINATSDQLAHIASVLDNITKKVDAVVQVAAILSSAGLI